MLAPEHVGECVRIRAQSLRQRGATLEVCPGKQHGAWPTRDSNLPWLRRTQGGRWGRGSEYR